MSTDNTEREISAAEVAKLIKTGYVKFVEDENYNSETKNSLMDYYNLTKYDVIDMFRNTPSLKGLKVVFPKQPVSKFKMVEDLPSDSRYAKKGKKTKEETIEA